MFKEKHIVQLPLPLVSSENLARYAQISIVQEIDKLVEATDPELCDEVEVSVAVFEGEGQGAGFSPEDSKYE